MLEYIQRYLAQNQRAPFIREIQANCQIASYKSAVDRLNALERKGFIKRTSNKHRGIKLLHRFLDFTVTLEQPFLEAAEGGPLAS